MSEALFLLHDKHLSLQFKHVVGGGPLDGGGAKREVVEEAFGGGIVENWIAAGEVTGQNSERFCEIEGDFSMRRRCGCGNDVVAEMIIGCFER